MKNDLAQSAQMQFMRPGQLEAAARNFPVVYVPFGLIEWHGRHLPLGNDALKAHGILVKTAEKFGGVVYPPSRAGTSGATSSMGVRIRIKKHLMIAEQEIY